MTDRFLRIVLILSLTLNVFIVGAGAGAAYMWFAAGHGGPLAGAAGQGLRFAADDLSPELRKAFREALRQTRRDARPIALAAREGRREVARLLAEPSLNRIAIDATLARTRNADMTLRTRLEQSIVLFAEKLSPQEREVFVEGLKRGGPLRQQRGRSE